MDLFFQCGCLAAGGVKVMIGISFLRGAMLRPGIIESGSADVRKPKGFFFLAPFLMADVKHKSLPT